jgi:tetratricopeptide (TPR) repeat protein
VNSSSLVRWIAGSALVVLVTAAPMALAATTPSLPDLNDTTVAGAYLAARHAGQIRDPLTAAAYYRAALRLDPNNENLRDRAFLSLLVGGNIDEAAIFAKRIVRVDKGDSIARLVLGANDIAQKHYAAARHEFKQSVRGPITDLTATLLDAWSLEGLGDSKEAVAQIDKLSGPDWYGIFKDLHAGMILDLAGDEAAAGKRFEQAYKLDPTALRVVEAYGSWLSRNGQVAEARKIFADFGKVLPDHPLIVDAVDTLNKESSVTAAAPMLALAPGNLLMKDATGAQVKTVQGMLGIATDGIFGPRTRHAVVEFQRHQGLAVDGIVGPRTEAKLNEAAGQKENAANTQPAAGKKRQAKAGMSPGLPRLINSVQDGAAEALYGLGASLGHRGGEDLGLVYLQLALHLEPKHALALLSLADLYESLKKPELAIDAYERVPASSPLHRNAAIQMATDLDLVNRGDEAEQNLEKLIKQRPKDIEAIIALGNVLRGHKKFAECGKVYSQGIDAITRPVKDNWPIYYFRGICYERSHQWPKAEADFKEALKLYPDQPSVLNYLGYSWIDRGMHLDEAMNMIKKAVQQRPDDGYIVDSLGWAYYQLGDYKEAVKQLEHAILLKPEDPTINDHYGDALWRVGRKLEARYQWVHSRDMKPDPEELVKVEEKLKHGLPAVTSSQATVGKKNKSGKDGG